MGRRGAVLCALWVGLLGAGCEKPAPSKSLSWHAAVKIKDPIEPIEAACGGRRCPVDHPRIESLDYSADGAGRVDGVLVRYKLPHQRSVEVSQNVFAQLKQKLEAGLGESQTFLQSGDPCYWPARSVEERVVELTVDRDDRTILAVGAVGPNADKVPTGGAARDIRRVEKFWTQVFPLLAEDKPAKP